ncbi:MAG TPA: hypothetical protein ENI64_07220 [Gammaproteobacteria bacterium]|nr:hypothetical protein [Gammaproteobacteria bacterium]
MANPESLGRTLYRRLAVENRTEHKARDRLRFIEQLREQVLYCTDHFRDRLVKSSLPMSSRTLKNATQARALLTELTNAYKIVIVDMLQASRVDNKLVALASQRALHSLTRLLMINYAHYAPAPQNIWMELHRLFHLGEARDLLHIKLRDDSQKTKRASVSLEYKRTLLLSLANPYRLRRCDIAKVACALQDWAEQVDIERSAQFTHNQRCFIVDLDSDQPPNPIQHNRVTDQVYNRFINLTRLNILLRDELQDLDPAINNTCSMSHDTLRKLLLTWEMRSLRTFKRTAERNTLGITVGLNNTCEEINRTRMEKDLLESAEQLPTPDTSESRQEQAPPPLELIDIQTGFSLEPDLQDNLTSDPWDQRHLNQQRPPEGDSQARPDKHTPADRFGPVKQNWKMINISAGGYCIMWDQDTPNTAQVGEVVGIQETCQRGTQSWNIGIVRWIEYQPEKGLKMGIQVIAPNAMAVSTYPYGLKQPDIEQALQLPELAVIDQPATLVTSTGHYKIGDRLIVDHHGRTTVVQLTREIEHTGSISRFQYNELNNKVATNTQQQANEPDTQEIKLSGLPDDYWNWPES